MAEIERLTPREENGRGVVPRGGNLVVALSNPDRLDEPGDYETTEEHEVVANVFETLVTTDPQGASSRCCAESWSLEDGGRPSVCASASRQRSPTACR
jgi:hypothetical protein